MRRRSHRKREFLILGALLLLPLVTTGFLLYKQRDAQYYGERLSLLIDPTAEKAYAYGLAHFDPGKPEDHDLHLAEYFFRRAEAMDANYPYVHHQLARIAFLSGRSGEAIREIDTEIALYGDAHAPSFYVRGLIWGFAGRYAPAAADFEHFLTLKPVSWAGSNDYAWVLMKGGRYEKAVEVLSVAAKQFPENAWVLNSYAIALYHTGRTQEAAKVAAEAVRRVMQLTASDWSHANPGNDPYIAGESLKSFQNAVIRNLATIEQKGASDALQL